MISVRFFGPNIDELKKEMREFLKEAPPRRKIIAGENIDDGKTTLKEVQIALKRVEDEIGKEYVGIILQRIPTAGIASLKVSEYSRCVRLCLHYLNDQRRLAP